MDTLFTFFLIVHIVNGATGLIAGTINLIRRKGDLWHKRIGVVFAYSMNIAGISAIVLSILNPNYFLTIVGVFTIYMVSTAYRYIRLRLTEIDNDPKNFDWFLTVCMGIAGLLFVGLGALTLFKANTFGIVYIVFGCIGLLFVRADIKNYRGKARQRNYWLLAHLQRMTGGYIAALTAFLVVNADNFPSIIPGLVLWLLPTAVLTPLIIIWSRKYSM
ncbi:MAG: hypothetical protein SH808_00805 [Saprospiraceae bacterium]|nr:hypothetical protein [Saprospiraceae bacterium]